MHPKNLLKPHNYALLILFICLGVSTCTHSYQIDPSISSVEANDLTAHADASELQGCGTQLQSGLLFCRLHERTPTSSKITFVGPKSNCKRDACVFIQIFFPTAEPTLEVSIPKDSTQVSVQWKDIVKRTTFERDDRGFWPFVRTTFWYDADGNERRTVDDGLIFLRILRPEYETLHESRDNPYFTFSDRYGEVLWRWTTSGRTYVEKAIGGKP